MACRAAGRKLVAESHAPAPGPAGAEPPANLLFTVSAPRAVLTAGVLELQNVASEVLFHTERGDTGVFATGPAHSSCPRATAPALCLEQADHCTARYGGCQPCCCDHRSALENPGACASSALGTDLIPRCAAATFANGSAGGKFVGASGQWLAQPTAVLRATDSTGSRVSALLSLAEPSYNATRGTLTFKARPLVCLSVAPVSLHRSPWLALRHPFAHMQHWTCTSLCRQACKHAHCTGFTARRMCHVCV